MQFVHAFPHILQATWEADPYKIPFQVSKLDITDAYHCGILRLSQVGAFAYSIPVASDNDFIIICIDMVLPMGWVESPKIFCAFLETLTYMENSFVHTLLPVPWYGTISKISKTGLGSP